jgi:arginyl-tRNA synthetase
MITDVLANLVLGAVDRAVADGALPAGANPEIHFEHPKRREHGDWATNVALVLAKGGNPRSVAAALVERLPASDLVAGVEVAGPGFINFRLSPGWLHDVVVRAGDPGSGFGRSDHNAGTSLNIEYVSPNPTGPVNVVSGRQAAVGDTIANLLAATGASVTRESLLNDAGRQIELFGRSIAARYLDHHGVDAEIPEGGYHGDYVAELAESIATEVGDRYVDVPAPERDAAMRKLGLKRMRASITASLERFGTRPDVWFSETTLRDSGAVSDAVERLRTAGFVEERDGAQWFLSSRLGDDKDRVVVRSTGEPTYLAADAAYLLDKRARGFDRLVYLWGPDHHGTIARLLAAADALGITRQRVDVRLVQVVSILRRGEAVKSSKRAGNIVALDDLVDEVGTDAARYTFLTRSIDAPLDFDIELAKEQAPENPVYYVQYAHARICSIIRRAVDAHLRIDARSAPLDLLGHPSEEELMRKLASYEEIIPNAAQAYAPQKVTRFLEELGADFSAFYRDCRVISEDEKLSRARLALCDATRAVIADGLSLLGIAAPARM